MKHIWKGNGWRKHVIHWEGHRQPDGSIKGVEKCSEPDCEINKK